MNPLRTMLFVPGNRVDRVDKALSLDADAIIIDLEDSVPISEKEKARELTGDLIKRAKRKNLYVRINGLGTGYVEGDISAVANKALQGIVLPKAEKREDIIKICELLNRAEKEADLEQGSIKVIPIVESALGMEMIYEIASARPSIPRVKTIAFGAADYSLDLGISLSKEGTELLYPRARMAVACRAGGLEPPIDTPWMIDIQDVDGLIADAKRAKALGFQGKLVIHPSQIKPVNEVFTPSQEEIEQSMRIMQAFEQAERTGTAAVVLDGKFIDYPVVERARRTIELWKAIGGNID
ncbi:MAG: CoA ester lyase [Candidatus Bathyarchaeia archaeon]